jgi:hypothetical protein
LCSSSAEKKIEKKPKNPRYKFHILNHTMPSPNATRYVGYLGAAANWLIPLAAMKNVRDKPAEDIDPVMTSVLAVYSCTFFRWALAISPANYPLAACHAANAMTQTTLLGKRVMYAKPPVEAAKLDAKKL